MSCIDNDNSDLEASSHGAGGGMSRVRANDLERRCLLLEDKVAQILNERDNDIDKMEDYCRAIDQNIVHIERKI